ncbi:alpha-2,8-sialyltransferase 8F-like [Lytechinus pictus]|uniref:alpha-2,8-sialyltransferase 8F-like n=1 Tax=Lytechinus pictus TaxID=7653 RepID=UPI0030B9D068
MVVTNQQGPMARNKVFASVCLVLSGMVATYVILSEIHLTRECHYFCTSDDLPVCYLRRSAVLIYDQDVAAHEMSFSQNTHPRINLANYATEVASGRYFDINCPVNHYWPRVSTLDRRNSCAVVGNSGILSGSRCGRVIDKHDFIIRANLAPIEDYTTDVGQHSNLTIMNFETLFYLHNNLTQTPPDTFWHRTYVERLRYLNDSILWYSKSTLQRNSSFHLKDVVHVLKDYYHLPIQLAYSWRPVSVEKFHGLRHYATTGFNAVIIAKTFCNHVTLYGFYPSNAAENGYHVNHHYYEDVEFDYVGSIHNFKQEFTKLKEFEEKGEITIVTDLCPGGRRKKVTDHVNMAAMLDTKFAFNLNKDRLKEIFELSDDTDDPDGDEKERTVARIPKDTPQQFHVNPEVDSEQVIKDIQQSSEISRTDGEADVGPVISRSDVDISRKDKAMSADGAHRYKGNYGSIVQQK